MNIFSLEAGLFWPSFFITVGVLLGIFAFGFLYENTRLVANCIHRIIKRAKARAKAGEWVVSFLFDLKMLSVFEIKELKVLIKSVNKGETIMFKLSDGHFLAGKTSFMSGLERSK